MKKTILITGSNGFVGRSLIEFFSQNNNYILISATRQVLNLLDSDSVANFFKNNKIDTVIHTANQGGSRVTGYDTTSSSSVVINNLTMFLNLTANMGNETRLITFGSGAEYNKFRDLNKVSEIEIGKILPKDEYGFSKLIMKKIIDKSENICSPIIFGLFGRFEDYRFKFISNAILKNIFRMPITINQNVIFDYLYIDDFNELMKIIIDNNIEIKSFNITPNESISLIDIAKIINEISDYKSDIIIKNEGLNYQYSGSNKLLLSKIGDYKFLTYHESIERLYNYFNGIIDTIDYKEIVNDAFIENCKTKNQ